MRCSSTNREGVFRDAETPKRPLTRAFALTHQQPDTSHHKTPAHGMMKDRVEVLTAYSHPPNGSMTCGKRSRSCVGKSRTALTMAATRTCHGPASGLWQTNCLRTTCRQSSSSTESGPIGKDLAAKFGISLSSIRRLHRTHGARLSDHHEDTD